MNRLYRNPGLKFIAIFAFVLLGLLFAHPGGAAAQPPYNYTNYLMDDAVFTAPNTMTAQDIQTFLQNEGSGLAGFSDIEDCGSPSGAHYAFYATYYACGQRASAAQIIYSAAQAYGINPKAILATMEKEQSLVTTPNPSASQLNFAMGYGCPDSGGCGYSGFFNQVDNGTWQFRTDFELASGRNYWGYTPASYPCNGPTRYYSQALLPGNDVTFIDDNGIGYTHFVLLNASIATLYCYTPHVYPGSSQEFYSGSRNFVYYFTLWFVPYSVSYYNQSAYPVLKAGQSSSAFISYRNTGNTNWYDDTNAAANGAQPVHLAVGNPVNSGSPFSYGWPSAGRPAVTFGAIYNADGVTLATDQHAVLPGEIGRFNFNITAPWTIAPGTYRTYFQPVLEGATNWNMAGVSWIDTTIIPTVNALQYYNQSSYPALKAGQQASTFISYRNTGNTNLYDDTYAATNGVPPVHLAVTNPINSASSFGWDWPSLKRPALLFNAVYNSDGVTLASNQHYALPGQIIKFAFNITVPYGYSPGSYRTYFQPVLEGAGNWNLGGVAWIDVNVVPDIYAAQYAGQSPYLTLSAGQVGSTYLQYQNVGNTNWYDDSTAAANSKLPVHLATANPINKPSSFGWDWTNNTRPALNFSAVYESDGVTLATNQHIVQPGQIARFTFNLTVPYGYPNGTYTTYFQPLLEGAANWNMGGFAWANTTVH